MDSAASLRSARRDWLLCRYFSGRASLWKRVTSLLPQADHGDSLSLDVGCGIRPFDRVLSARGYRPVGVDLRNGQPDVWSSALRLPFDGEAFSLALCINMLQYVDEPRSVLEEIQRVLLPRSPLVVALPAFWPLDPEDKWRWTPRSAIDDLEASGFDEVTVLPIGPTPQNLLHLLGLSVRKMVPILGPIIATALEVPAYLVSNSKDVRFAGGYALRGLKRA